MNPVSCTNTHPNVTDLVNHEMFKNTKTRISWERNITLLWNKKILNLCLRWHILRSYRFVAEGTFTFTGQQVSYPCRFPENVNQTWNKGVNCLLIDLLLKILFCKLILLSPFKILFVMRSGLEWNHCSLLKFMIHSDFLWRITNY